MKKTIPKVIPNCLGKMMGENQPYQWRNNLTFRYLSLALGMIATVQVLFGFVQVKKSYSQQVNNLENKVREEAEFLSAVSSEAILEMDFLALEQLIKQTSLDREIIYGVFVNENGRALTRYLDRKNPLVAQVISNSQLGNREILEAIALLKKDSGIREIRHPIISHNKVLGEVWLGYCMGTIKKELYRVAINQTILAVLVSILIAILTIILFEFEIRIPLKELVSLAGSLSDGHLNKRVYIYRNNELKIVGYAFNDMAERLQKTLIGLQEKIIEHKAVERQLKESLQEKEMLLKEIHHRVKNNLLLVTNLLELQSEYTEDSTLDRFLGDSQKRLYSMALIHEKLSRDTGLGKINFGEYIESLLSGLYPGDNLENKHLEFEFDIEPISLNIETAQPCGLIVNELLSNAIKHGFVEGDRGKIKVAINAQPNGQIKLAVADNGQGFPQDLDFRDPQSLGLQLVQILTAQLEGTIDLDRTNGTSVQLTFKELDYKPRY